VNVSERLDQWPVKQSIAGEAGEPRTTPLEPEEQGSIGGP